MKLKKILLICFGVILITGCSEAANSPTKKVESFFSKYQNLDSVVLDQLDLILDKDTNYNDDNKKEYKTLMIKQYQNLSYKITNEKVEDNNAIVDVEVEVYDYKTAIIKANDYYNTHKEEFKDESLIDYQIKEMKDVTERSVYPITFNLTKNDKNNWVLDDISDIDRQKIHGLY